MNRIPLISLLCVLFFISPNLLYLLNMYYGGLEESGNLLLSKFSKCCWSPTATSPRQHDQWWGTSGVVIQQSCGGGETLFLADLLPIYNSVSSPRAGGEEWEWHPSLTAVCTIMFAETKCRGAYVPHCYCYWFPPFDMENLNKLFWTPLHNSAWPRAGIVLIHGLL